MGKWVLPIGVLTEAERERIPGLIDGGLGVLAGERLVLTLRGRLLADGVVASLLT